MQRPEMRLPWRRGVRVSLTLNSKHANASPPRLVHAAFSTDSKEQEAVKRAVQHHNHRVGSDAYGPTLGIQEGRELVITRNPL